MDTLETYLFNTRIMIIQPKDGFHASLDTVFLAAAIPIVNNAKILDLGCGVGSASLCALYHNKTASLTGIDIQPGLVELAKLNAIKNGMQDRAEFVQGDIRDGNLLKDDGYDIVMMNPPYLETGNSPSPNENKSLSHGHHVDSGTLENWIYFAHRKLKNGGRLVVVQRADKLDKLLEQSTVKFGNILILPLWPRTGDAAKRILFGGRKNNATPMVLHPGMVLHNADGSFTVEADQVLREAGVVELWK